MQTKNNLLLKINVLELLYWVSLADVQNGSGLKLEKKRSTFSNPVGWVMQKL